MRTFITIIISCTLLIVIAGCGDDESVDRAIPPGDGPAYDLVIDDLEDEFEIGFGEKVYIVSEDLEIYFEDLYESRCPSDVVCFWAGEGITDLRLTGPGGVSGLARPVIRPGMDPCRNTWLKDYALGYSFTLLSLVPYPSISEPSEREDYRATLLVEAAPDASEHGNVIFTFADPCQFDPDYLEILSAETDGDILHLRVNYSGGCEDHLYRLYAKPVFMESLPVRMDLYVHHEDNDDPCDAIITDDLSFNLSRIGELYKALYGGEEGVILEIAVCREGERGEEVSVLYGP